LRAQIAQLKSNNSDVIGTQKPLSVDSQNFQFQDTINKLQHENDWFRAENSKVKQHYKELYDSIKITRDINNEKITSLLKEIENLKTPVKGKMPIITCDNVVQKISACKKYAIDAVNIPLPFRNNKLVHRDYLKHLKECLDLLRETIEEDRIAKPLDDAVVDACFLTNRSQELLEYAIGTCPKTDNMRDGSTASSSMTKNKHVTFVVPLEISDPNTSKHVQQPEVKKTKIPISPSTEVNSDTKARESKPRRNRRNYRTSHAKSVPKKKVDDHMRNIKSNLSKMSHNSKPNSRCKTCNECIISSNHDKCVEKFLKSFNKTPVKKVWRAKLSKQIWKATGKLFANVGYQWKPTGRKFTLGE
jgi:hypothetical protein